MTNDNLRTVVIVLTLFLGLGTLFYFAYFTRRNRRPQFYVLMPVLIALNLWLTFEAGWHKSDFFQWGMILVLCVIECIATFQTRPKE